MGWKSSCRGGEFLVGALTSSSEPLKKHSLLGWKIPCWVGSLLVGVDVFLLVWRVGSLLVGVEDFLLGL